MEPEPLIINSTPARPQSEPEEPAPLSPEEHELLSLVEPGGHFSFENRLDPSPSFTYHSPDRRSKTFKNLPHHSFATARIEALQSLVKRGLIDQRGPEYALTYAGVALKDSSLPPSE